MHPFGRFPGRTALDMAVYSVRAALADAGITWDQVQQAVGGSYTIDNPDVIVSRLGQTGIPFLNVYNGCGTAGSALMTASNMIRLGECDIAVAVGLDKHEPGACAAFPEPYGLPAWYGDTGLFLTTKFFGMKINRYMHDPDISPATLAKVAAKNFRNGERNDKAWRRKPLSEEVIAASATLNYPLTQYMFCGPDEGAAAVVLCRADRAKEYTDRAVRLRAAVLRTRRAGSYEVHQPWAGVTDAVSPTVDAADAAYEMAGVGPEDIDIAQLQDTDSGAEIIHMAETRLCRDGEQEAMINAGETEISGRLPVNTDGGLMANGEPVGASGLRQVHEIVLQLRQEAGDRQVAKPPRTGLTQVYGAPGIAAVTILST